MKRVLGFIVTVVLVIAAFTFFLRQHDEVATKSTETATSVPMPPAPEAAPQIPEEKFYKYEVKKGDWLSCLSPDHWKDIYETNRDVIKNPNRIFPNQILMIPREIVLTTDQCAAKKVSAKTVAVKIVRPAQGKSAVLNGRVINGKFIPYCRIGADPVNRNRAVMPYEREIVTSEDHLVTMQSGSGKAVTCILKRGQTVVVDAEGRAQWVLACGNPILNTVFITEAVPKQKPPQPAAKEKEAQREPGVSSPIIQPGKKPEESKRSGLIILKTFEGQVDEAKPNGGSITRDGNGNPVVDSSGNAVKAGINN